MTGADGAAGCSDGRMGSAGQSGSAWRPGQRRAPRGAAPSGRVDGLLRDDDGDVTVHRPLECTGSSKRAGPSRRIGSTKRIGSDGGTGSVGWTGSAGTSGSAGRVAGGLRGGGSVMRWSSCTLPVIVSTSSSMRTLNVSMSSLLILDVALDVARGRRLDGADDVDQRVLRPRGKGLDHVQRACLLATRCVISSREGFVFTVTTARAPEASPPGPPERPSAA